MKVIVAIEASEASQNVISEVIVRRWPQGTRFEVVTVADTAHFPLGESVGDELMSLARKVSQRGTLRLQDAGYHASACALLGDPKSVILQYAADGAADWIVAGAHSGLVEEFLMGGVAKALIRQAPCPVAIVRPSGWRKDDQPGRKILMATDGSAESEEAARSVAARPWPPGTQVRVLSVVELNVTLLQAFEPPLIHSAAVEEMRVKAMSHAQAAVTGAREALQGTGLSVTESISVLLEKPSKVILDEAKQWGADLIVVGSHGRRGWSRLWLGSTSETVAMHAECSVEVVRPSHARSGWS